MNTLLQTCAAALSLGIAGVSASGAELAVKTGDKIAFLGDSITQAGWQWPGGYVRLVADGLEKCGARVVILTATPIGEDQNANNEKLAAYNDFLRALAAAVERHPAGEILDASQVKKEASKAFDEAMSQNSN